MGSDPLLTVVEAKNVWVLASIAVMKGSDPINATHLFQVDSMTTLSNNSSDSRRSFLATAGAGAGILAYAAMAVADGARGIAATHLAPRARRVIWLFMHGGPSHVDLCDPKRALAKCAEEQREDEADS